MTLIILLIYYSYSIASNLASVFDLLLGNKMKKCLVALTLGLVPNLAFAFGYHNTGPDYLTGFVVFAPGFLFLVFVVAARSGELLKGIVGQVAPWLVLVGAGYVLIEWRFKAFIGLSLAGYALLLFLHKALKSDNDK